MNDDQCVEFNQLYTLGLLWVITIILTVGGSYLSTWAFPDADAYAGIRPLAMRFAPLILFSMLLITIMVLWDFLTPGNTLEIINSDPKSAAIFYSVFVASIAYMVVWIA